MLPAKRVDTRRKVVAALHARPFCAGFEWPRQSYVRGLSAHQIHNSGSRPSLVPCRPDSKGATTAASILRSSLLRAPDMTHKRPDPFPSLLGDVIIEAISISTRVASVNKYVPSASGPD
ncbi:hypothetical protein FGB62_69g265 [Gracilaria domingensis]|nr:hypothetical protein FGB62_69g265 [Gracilaria domingensis]